MSGSAGIRLRSLRLIEYSDFTCGYCQKFFSETWPSFNRNMSRPESSGFSIEIFLAPLKGRESMRRLRLDAQEIRESIGRCMTVCTADDLTCPTFSVMLQPLGLNLPEFTKCYQEGRYTDAIFKDKDEGTYLGFRGTPGFVLMLTRRMSQESPLLIPGAFPFEVFEEEIDRLLKLDSPALMDREKRRELCHKRKHSGRLSVESRTRSF